MDPRSTDGGLTELEQALCLLERQGGVEFENLRRARARTDEELAAKAEQLATLERDDDVAVVLMGSWGRRELTSQSDDDFMVLVGGEPRDGVQPSIEEVGRYLGGGFRKPGKEGLFGAEHVFVSDLVGHIGLDRDDNRNVSRRMLLVLESVAAVGHDAHAAARDAVLAGYLDPPGRSYRPPRFFLNDTVRYWRTICVDFVGKERERDDGWGLRNAKLRLSRKVLFAGGLLPILECHRLRAEEMLGFFRTRFGVTPIERLAGAFLAYDALDAGVRTLSAYDQFLALLDDPAKREELQRLDRTTADDSALFEHVKHLGSELESGLLTLLFDTELGPLVREFGIF